MTPKRPKFSKWLEKAHRRGLAATIVERIERRLLKHPGDAWLHFQLGSVFCEMSLWAPARRHLAKAWRHAPDKGKPAIARWVAETYGDMHDLRRARKWFERCIALDPTDAESFNFYGFMLSGNGLLDEAEAVFQRATRCEKGAVDEAYLNIGLICRAQRRYAEAEAAIRTALALTPDYREAQKALDDVVQARRLLGPSR